MKKIYILLISCLLIACSNQKLSPISRGDTIVALGDSLTFGYGANPKESYPSILKNKYKLNIINEGVNGNTTMDGLNRLNEVIEKHNPKLIILGLGGNDMLRKISDEKIILNLKKIISTAQSKNIQILLLSTPRPSMFGAVGYLSDADFYKKLSKEVNVPLVENVYSKWLSKKEYKSDLIHLNNKGYEKVADQIYESLIDFGAIKK